MITIRKLRSLPPGTRLRKTVRILDGVIHYRSLPAGDYLNALCSLAAETADELGCAGVYVPRAHAASDDERIRGIDSFRHRLRACIDIPVADWDLMPPAGYGARLADHDVQAPGIASGVADSPVRIYVESVRSPFNAGSIVRTAAALGVTRMALSPDCQWIDHPRFLRTARGAERLVVCEQLPLADLGPDWGPLIALETGGELLEGFAFPLTGTLLVGSEELGLSAEALRKAAARVSIGMTGLKASLNVGVACGIALHAWIVDTKVTDSRGLTR